MYKSLNQHSGEEIILLDPRWRHQIARLRALDRQDALVCQGCRQPVRVRAGQVKRWHFAHKHLQNCPYEFESPLLLKSRAVLYEWLVRKFGEGVVTLEKQLDGSPLSRHVDCWVEGEEGSLAYWIIETRMTPEARQDLKTGLVQASPHPVWIFVSEMLREDEKDAQRIHLTTTERAFMRSSEYDQILQSSYASPGSSLHYLEPESETLTTFRGLQLTHAPQLYVGHRYSSHLSLVNVSRQTGEFVHPGEDEQLQRFRERKVEQEKELQTNERRIAQKLQELFGKDGLRRATNLSALSAFKPGQDIHPTCSSTGFGEGDDSEAPTCLICGKKTDDYWYLNRVDNTCKCRECYRQGKY